MAKRFTRNVIKVTDIDSFNLENLSQNDLVSDDRDVYIFNQGKLSKVTGQGSEDYDTPQVIALIIEGDTNNTVIIGEVRDNYAKGQKVYCELEAVYKDKSVTKADFTYDPQLHYSSATLVLKKEDIKSPLVYARIFMYEDDADELIAEEVLIASDWNDNNPNSPRFIANKPNLTNVVKTIKVTDGKTALVQGDKIPVVGTVTDENAIYKIVLKLTHDNAAQAEVVDTVCYVTTLDTPNIEVTHFVREEGTKMIQGEFFSRFKYDADKKNVTCETLESSVTFSAELIGIWAYAV